MTGYEAAYLTLAIAALVVFSIMLAWVTHRTNPTERRKTQDQADRPSTARLPQAPELRRA